MAGTFDPYHIWLGIPPEEQPADHYRLLGVRRYESNDEVIINAADQRVRHLRSMQTGKRQAETQKLLNEISAASGILLNGEKRKEYDAQLKAKDAAKAPSPNPGLVRPLPVAAALPAARPQPIPVAAPAPPSSAPQPSATVAAAPLAPLIVAPTPSRPPSLARQNSTGKWILIAAVAGVSAVVLVIGVGLGILGMLGGKAKTAANNLPVPNLPPHGTGPQVLPATGGNPTFSPGTAIQRKSYPMPTNWDEANLLPEQRMPQWFRGYSWDEKPRDLLVDVPHKTLTGSFVPRKSGPAHLETGGTLDALEFEYQPPPVYHLALHLKRQQGSGPVAIDFPAGGKQCRLILDLPFQKGLRSGLDVVDGKSLTIRNDSSVFDGEIFLDEITSVIMVLVGPEGVSASVTQGTKEFWFFSRFEGDPQRLGRDDRFSKFIPVPAPHIGLSFNGSRFVIEGATAGSGGKQTTLVASTDSAALEDRFLVNTSVTAFKGNVSYDIMRGKRTDLLQNIPRTTDANSITVVPGSTALISGPHLSRTEFQFLPPADYLLEAEVTRLTGENGIIFNLVKNGHAGSLVIDGYRTDGYYSGVELVDGQRANVLSPPVATRGKRLKTGERAKVQAFVVGNRIFARVGSEFVADWTGQPESLSRNTNFVMPNSSYLSVATDSTSYRIDSLYVSPVKLVPSQGVPVAGTSEGSPPSPNSLKLGTPVDILKIRPSTWGSSEWRDGKLSTRNPNDRLAMMAFNHIPKGEYLLEAKVTRSSGKDGIQFGIAVDGRPCTVALDCFIDEGRGAHSGLELINGQRMIAPNYPAVHKGDVLTNDKSATVQIFVRKGRITLHVDGKQLIDWKGDSARLSRTQITLGDAGPSVAVGVWKSVYTIDSLKVYPIADDNIELATKDGATAVDLSAKPVEFTDKEGKSWTMKPLEKTDLLANVKRTVLAGSMTAKDGLKGIVSGGREPDKAEFNFAVPEEYVVDATFTRLAGQDALVLGLVANGRPTGLVIGGFAQEGILSGLELLQGRRLNAQERPPAVQGSQFVNGEKVTLRVYVKRDAIVAELNGRRIANWIASDGPLDRDPNHQTPNLRNFYLGMWQSSYHVESLTITKSEAVEKKRVETKVELVKIPVPDEATLEKARGELKAAYGDFEQKGKKPEEKLKLSQEFVSVAASEKGPALRYALLDAARRLAVEGQDLRAALDVTGVIEENFEGDGLDLHLQTLKLAATATLPPSAWETAAELAGELASVAQEKGRLTLADSAAQLAVDYASHSKSTDFKKSFKQLRDKVAAQLKEWEVVKAAEQTLASKPDDPAANLAVGKWNCLHLGDWDKGIPQLARSSDAKLAAAAVAEKDDKLLPAADAWSLAAEALNGIEKVATQRHSLELYQEASEKLTGLEQLKAAKRVNEVTELLAQSASESPGVAGMTPRSKMASDALRPGLLIRVYASQPPKSPTPALGVIRSYGDFAVRKDQLARALNYPAKRLTFAGIGYIELDKDESLSFRAKNATVFVDGNKVISNNPDSATTTGSKKKSKNSEVVKRTIKKGRHSLQIVPFDATADGPDVRITRDSGESVISYSPADLDTELGRDILFHGSSAKGKFSLGNR